MAKKTGVPVRKDDLLVQKLGEETIVYDLSAHRAHSLNRTAGLVFEKLDGKKNLDEVSRGLGKALGRPPQAALVTAAINELAAADLLQPGTALPRRSVLRGLAAGLLPVVATIAVPGAAAAASCFVDGDPCTIPGGSGECCYGLSCLDCGGGDIACRPFGCP